MPGKANTMTDDGTRHGSTTLLAVLNGTAIGTCRQRLRHQEFIRFLDAIERAVPAGKVIPFDPRQLRRPQAPNGPAMAGPASALSLPCHADFRLLAERCRNLFSALTRKQLKRGVLRSIVDLQPAINRYLDEHNADPKLLLWRKPASKIIGKLNPVNVSVP
jgi:hypothetical protein